MSGRYAVYQVIIAVFTVFISNTFFYFGIDKVLASQTNKPTLQKMSRGINLGNALEAPHEGDWGVVIKDEYFKIIKQAGFDTVRIPIRWSEHCKNTKPYTVDAAFFKRVDYVINEALKNNLIVVINIHHFNELMEKPKEQKDKLFSLWQQISTHYKSWSSNLYFELLNEPTFEADLWNEYINQLVKIIRKTNPKRKIIIGGVNWNSIEGLDKLKLPSDSNIMATFHFYEPFNFTHQGAEWVNPIPPVGTVWPETDYDYELVKMRLDKALEWAKKNKVKLFLGEFGAYSKADMKSRVKWTSFVARESEKRGIAWCYWEFCSGFGAYDPVKNTWRSDLLNSLIPTKAK